VINTIVGQRESQVGRTRAGIDELALEPLPGGDVRPGSQSLKLLLALRALQRCDCAPKGGHRRVIGRRKAGRDMGCQEKRKPEQSSFLLPSSTHPFSFCSGFANIRALVSGNKDGEPPAATPLLEAGAVIHATPDMLSGNVTVPSAGSGDLDPGAIRAVRR